jgi:CO dehydrogenase/acetyl-CoA synthase gamma subunit (corrinoid Fe-S protein)
MTEQDKAYEINELTHRLEAAKLNLDAIIIVSITGDIKMFKDRIKEFESRIVRII